ncbi:MAG: hypothetical protein ABFS45_18080 [Pseudomonadota bacterium]
MQIGELKRIEITLPLEDALKLKNLAKHWKCTRTDAFKRILVDAWTGKTNQCDVTAITQTFPIYGILKDVQARDTQIREAHHQISDSGRLRFARVAPNILSKIAIEDTKDSNSIGP